MIYRDLRINKDKFYQQLKFPFVTSDKGCYRVITDIPEVQNILITSKRADGKVFTQISEGNSSCVLKQSLYGVEGEMSLLISVSDEEGNVLSTNEFLGSAITGLEGETASDDNTSIALQAYREVQALNNNLSNYYTKEESDEEFPKYDSIITVGEKSASVNTLFEDILTIWDGIFAELRNYCTVEKADETFIKSAEVITDGETSATVHTVLTDSLNLGSYAIRDDTLYYTSGKETNYYWNEIVDEVYKIASKADKPTITFALPSATTDDPVFTATISLKNNTEVRVIEEVERLAIELPETIDSDFISSFVFTSGETAVSMEYDETIIMSGDDCIDNVFAPVANKRYTVIISYDGEYLIGDVRGVRV